MSETTVPPVHLAHSGPGRLGAHDPATFSGRLNQELLTVSAGQIDPFRALAGLLLLGAGIDAGLSLARGAAIPWLRVLSYLLAALAAYLASDQPGGAAASPD